MDPLFRVDVLDRSPEPGRNVWSGMHQDYSEKYIFFEDAPENEMAEKICVKRLLQGGRGHYGPYEHTSMVVAAGYFPHSVVQQLRTHRVGISFDVQSLRYTGQRFIDVADGKAEVEEVFYIRPVGSYNDRNGTRYVVTEGHRRADIELCVESCKTYKKKVDAGYAFEHARSCVPFDFRQHFVVSFNARSLMHVLDLRLKLDAQEEIQQFCKLLFERFAEWMPLTAQWYQKDRLAKARLAP